MAPSLVSVPTMVTQKKFAALSCVAGRGGGRGGLEGNGSTESPSQGRQVGVPPTLVLAGD